MSEDKRLNEVIRVQKRTNNFVMMDKGFLEDVRLSYKAKGILAYLLSKPDNWKVVVGNLVNYSKDGKASVYAGLKELSEFGYYKKIPIRDDKGHFVRWESTVYECPYPLTDFRQVGNPKMDCPEMGNQEHNNNYITKDLDINNNSLSCQTVPDGQTDMQATLQTIRASVSYDELFITHPDDMPIIDEFIDIILDAVLSKCGTVRISGEDKPRELVKSNLMKLKYDNILYVLGQFKSHQTQIKKKPQYILTMLYHSVMELQSHYVNLVNSDWKYEGG